MTTSLTARITVACLAMLLMLAPAALVRAQEKEPPAPGMQSAPADRAAAEPLSQESGSLITPPSADNGTSGTVAIPAAEATQQPEQTAETAQAPAKTATVYTIKQGDTLWDISNSFFRDPYLWPLIWQANPYIADADLIYPGNNLTIPELAPAEREVAEVPQPAPEKAAPAPTVAEEAPPVEPTPEPKSLSGLASARATRPKHRVAKPEEGAPEEAAPGSRLILPEEEPLPIIDKYTMLSAGFVNDLESRDSILEAVETGKEELAYDDLIYLKFASPESVSIGDKFLVFKPLGIVRHPVTHKRFGRMIRGTGIVEITAKDPETNILTGRITLSFDSIQPGDPLTPYQEPALMYSLPAKRAKDVSGYILTTQDARELNGQTDVVYLDKGIQDGVDVGDQFTVYADRTNPKLPRKAIGDVLVFLVKNHSATAMVKKSTQPILPGNAISFKP